jgi:hypothetical protein
VTSEEREEREEEPTFLIWWQGRKKTVVEGKHLETFTKRERGEPKKFFNPYTEQYEKPIDMTLLPTKRVVGRKKI